MLFALDVTSYIIKQNPERLCLTVDTNKKGLESYPLRRHKKCSGQAFMFTYHRRKLQHTKTGKLINSLNAKLSLYKNQSIDL